MKVLFSVSGSGVREMSYGRVGGATSDGWGGLEWLLFYRGWLLDLHNGNSW